LRLVYREKEWFCMKYTLKPLLLLTKQLISYEKNNILIILHVNIKLNIELSKLILTPLKNFTRILLCVTLLMGIFGVSRVFLFDLYYIPSQSMQPTLFKGDVILVSKLSYGPRLPVFLKRTFNYKRLGDINKLERFDIVVFNYPMGDTIFARQPTVNYYETIAKNSNSMKDSILFKDVHQRETLVKRCVGLPGDTIQIEQRRFYLNGKALNIPGAKDEGENHLVNESDYAWRRYPLKPNHPKFWNEAVTFRVIFPNNYIYHWNHDIFGPIVVPKKGVSIQLDLVNIWLYKRVIEVYEKNNLIIDKTGILINGERVTSYTFKMDYFFMMGDNRTDSIDSMFWGFVPEDHIIGKTICVLFSSGGGMNNTKRSFHFL
jgi:signal peptidase I